MACEMPVDATDTILSALKSATASSHVSVGPWEATRGQQQTLNIMSSDLTLELPLSSIPQTTTQGMCIVGCPEAI